MPNTRYNRQIQHYYIKMIVAFLALLGIAQFAMGCATGKLSARNAAKIKDKVWVVTGASSGLGRGIVEEAAKHDVKLVLVARSASAFKSISDSINKAGGTSIYLTADISDTAALKLVLEEANNRFGGIDVWINNAGVTVFGNYWHVPFADHSRVIDVNLKGTMYASYIVLNFFLRKGNGTLLNIVSAESRLPTPYQAAYATSKAGLKSFGIVLRSEMRLNKQKDIKIISVDPWAMNTPIWKNAANYTGKQPGMGTMDRTGKTVNLVLNAVAKNKSKDYAVGLKTQGAYTVQRIAPRLAYRVAANIVNKHVVKAQPAEDTEGNLYLPSQHHQVETKLDK
jgi:short-subunit dehydrogenase